MQVAAGARSSFRLQESVAEMQESGRFLIDTLGDILRRSAFTPQPWTITSAVVGISDGAEDTVNRNGDRLATRTWSERNCYGAWNPLTDAKGLPRYFLKETILEPTSSGNLALTCRYGQSASQFVTQIRRQGLLQNVDSFQVLYAEDLDGDGGADRWTSGGHWHDPNRVLGLQIAVLLRGEEAVIEPAASVFNVLDEVVRTPADGRLRRVFTYVQALHRQ